MRMPPTGCSAEFDGALLAFQAERPGDFPGMELERLTMMDQTRVFSQLKISQDLDTNPLEIAHGDQVTEAFDRALDMGRIAIAAEAVGAAQALPVAHPRLCAGTGAIRTQDR